MNSSRFYFVLIKKTNITLTGPKINDEKNAIRFKKRHKNTFIKQGRIYAKEKIEDDPKIFFNNWIKLNQGKIKEMQIKSFRIAD